ncbi:hypothetical protein HYDPIDRAFT_26159 [Hydnomerulius pinastri MD-312]|nr:hypothetical protein HYDPIDRAFT_26159 [Hydnomerulius pinastri MD-312]
MIPKFANPHSLSLGTEITTREEHIQQTQIASTCAQDEETNSLERTLDDLLRDTWSDALAQVSSPPKRKKRRKANENHQDEEEKLMFRLVSSMKQPQYISLEPEAPPPPITREPECEDTITEAEERMKRAQSVAVELDCQWNIPDSILRSNQKSLVVEPKVLLAGTPVPEPLPAFLVVEQGRPVKSMIGYLRRIKVEDFHLDSPADASPHEPRATCPVLPVQSNTDRTKSPRRKHRKNAKERPPPAYWRPPPGARGKCMGYALGYPGSWASPAVDSSSRWYVRDTMTKAVHASPELGSMLL